MKLSQNVTWTLAILITWGGIGYDYYDRNYDRNHPPTFKDVPAERTEMRREFKNEEVPLDGVRYVECSFENVTFTYGATRPYELIGNNFSGTNTLKATSKEVGATVGLMLGLGLTRPGAHIDIPGTSPLQP